MYFFSRSDQFRMDFSFKLEADFNILVNFFFSPIFFQGISFLKLKMKIFYRHFSCKFEGDFNILVNFFFSPIFF